MAHDFVPASLERVLRIKRIRKKVFSHLFSRDFRTLRLVSPKLRKLSNKATFSSIVIRFHVSTFNKHRLAILEGIGHHVRELNFIFSHTERTHMYPVLDPNTRKQISVTFDPSTNRETNKGSVFGDRQLDDLALQNYGIIIFAAIDHAAFTQAIKSMKKLVSIRISCPGYPMGQPGQRSIVDYALWSLRIALERARPEGLRKLILSPVHLSGIQYLLPGTFPAEESVESKEVWNSISSLTMDLSSWRQLATSGDDLVYATNLGFLHQFLEHSKNIKQFEFSWMGGGKSVCPLTLDTLLYTEASGISAPSHRPLTFPRLASVKIRNIAVESRLLKAFLERHREHVREWDLLDMTFTDGNVMDALGPVIGHTDPGWNVQVDVRDLMQNRLVRR
ncbi:hypothetical protein DFH27DRAFT_612102 [Peziza echinospora]|nr:hypothetical protein DFH27DRAFT_612102 [Peziza echinospora]